MDSMQELRQEFNTILESYESADTPLTPLQKAERLRRLEEIARKANIECDNTIKKWYQKQQKREQERRERENFIFWLRIYSIFVFGQVTKNEYIRYSYSARLLETNIFDIRIR